LYVYITSKMIYKLECSLGSFALTVELAITQKKCNMALKNFLVIFLKKRF